MMKLRTLTIIGMTIVAFTIEGGAALADDTYKAGQLTMPTLQVGAATYSDVVVEVGSIVSGPTACQTPASVDVYDPATGNLSVPFIKLNGLYYCNYVIKVKRLVSIGAVTNVDTYDGMNVSIPSVQLLGGFLYNSVVATVGQVISAGGGMPQNVIDVYDPATHQLTVAAVMVGGKVYTNPVVTISGVVAAPEALVHSFGPLTGDADGSLPAAGLVQGPDGNFYGTTMYGGTSKQGSVFRLTPSGVETILHSFSPPADGALPECTLLVGSDGNFYGTAGSGGPNGYGTVFRLKPDGQETILYAFSGGSDGARPIGTLIQDGSGNLYGITEGGQIYQAATVFKLTPAGVKTVLHTFTDVPVGTTTPDGDRPTGSLVRTADGTIYGTTPGGGSAYGASGKGTVFRITPDGKETVLHQFAGPDGAQPYSGLIQGADGNFYGTTSAGGTGPGQGAGTVFRITPDGTETVVYAFGTNVPDGILPYAPLVQASDGSLYGTTHYFGGTKQNGAIFRIDPGGAETILYSFGGAEDGSLPTTGGALVLAHDDHLYGITESGGAAGGGAVFRY